MSYSNAFLREFRPVYLGILRAKRLRPQDVLLEIIDEELSGEIMFEPVRVREVLMQLAPDLNALRIYTDRPMFFGEFIDMMYEENGLVPILFDKKMCEREGRTQTVSVVLDFEWESACHFGCVTPNRYYIPIYKKPWKRAENLDIAVPIGYNTVIVKDIQETKKKPSRDRFEEAFYEK